MKLKFDKFHVYLLKYPPSASHSVICPYNTEVKTHPYALLFQVRMYGSFFQLTKAIQSYLAADDPGELFVKILERLEDDFDNGAVSR